MLFSLDILSPAQAAILLGIAALLGAVFGSFINCLAWRLVNGESVLRGRSHCTSCGHALGVLDLVPVFSWLALRGRCRHCGTKVSPRYLVVELVLAVIFAALLAVYGVGLAWVAYAALAVILVGVALVDLDTYTIPNGFVVAAGVVWMLLMAASVAGAVAWPLSDAFGVGSLFVSLVGAGWQAAALDGLAGAVGVGGGILVFSLVLEVFLRRPALGGGDVKLLFAVGLFLGLPASLLNLLVACILGLALALVPRPSVPDESLPTRPIPFGPAIAAATILTLLFGPPLLTWYVTLF